MRAYGSILLVAAASAVAHADPPQAAATSEAGSEKPWKVGVEPQFGVLVPTSKLGTFVTGGLQLDYAAGNFMISLDGGLTRPSHDGTLMDPRIAGGTATYTIDQTELVIGLLASYRFSTGKLVPRLGAGPVLQMLKSNETTSLAPGENTSTQTKVGFQLVGGVDYRLGGGFLAADVRFLYSGLDTMLTGSSNAGSIALVLGYRIVF